MSKKGLFIALFIASAISIGFSSSLFAWDRYTNEVEYKIGDYSFQKIMRYFFSISGSSHTVTLETKNTCGDTYMYLWSSAENRQIAKNDDDGAGYCSKIQAYLKPGNYIVFVRSYSSNAASTCDLYKNGVKVI